MQKDEMLATIWRRFRLGGELRPLICLAATLASAALLAGLGVGIAWLIGMFRPQPFQLPGRQVAGNVFDRDIWTGLSIAGAAWIASLIWLWRPAVKLNRHSLGIEGRRMWGRPIAISVLIAAAIAVLSYVIYRQPWDDTEYLVTSLALLGSCVAIIFWMPTVYRLELGRPLVGPSGDINVFCTQCGYSMLGLTTTTCPECGRQYTIDELIREQQYEAMEAGAKNVIT